MKQDRRSAKLSPKQKKKLIITSAVIAVAAVSAVVILRKTVSDKYGRNNEAEILSAEVSRGNISTSVYGSGLLSDDSVEELEIPSGVELEKIQVSAGDRISPGDLVFASDIGHVGIVGGRDDNGNLLIIHCTGGGYNNVVITGMDGFFGITARPQWY